MLNSEEFDVELFLRLLQGLVVRESVFINLFDANMSRAKHWCFTLNNYTQEGIEKIVGNVDHFSYIVFGKEIGENGTPHLQGFVSFPQRVRMNVPLDKIGQAHFTVARSVENSIVYCKKDGDFFEYGVNPSNVHNASGERNDLKRFKEAVKDGNLDMKVLRDDFSELVAKYPKFTHDYVQDHMPKKVVECFPLKPWQQVLYDKLAHTANDREIIFIVDNVGNAGKSWFAHYYAFMHDNAQVLLPGKKADMSYVLNPLIRVLFIDAPRSKQGDFIQYDFLEDVKNGYVFCSKYESRVKQLGKCHVVVMMNEDPDMNKLSLDRYDINHVN